MSSEKDPVFSEASPSFDVDRLSPEQKAAYQASQNAFSEEFRPDADQMKIFSKNGIKAGYKIEIMFGPKRTPQGPNSALVQAWESGRRLNGDADDLMYWCKDVSQKSQLGCGNLIPASAIHVGVAYCPHCKRMMRADKLTGQYILRHITTTKLAEEIAGLWHKLLDNADIYCKYNQDDIRYQAVMKEYGFEKARQLRGLFIYPLKNIIKDISNGSTVEARFRAFLSA